MRGKHFFVLTLMLAIAIPLAAKGSQKITPGQYVYEDGKLYMRTTQLVKFDHPYAPRVQPLAHIGLATCCITSIMTNAAGKWQVTFRVEAESGSYDVAFQLSPGDEWLLYAVDPLIMGQPGQPLVLKVVSIKNNEVEVTVISGPSK